MNNKDPDQKRDGTKSKQPGQRMRSGTVGDLGMGVGTGELVDTGKRRLSTLGREKRDER